MSIEQKVRDHFHADARRFDAIYDDDKGFLSRWVDGVWRGVVRRRFELTLDYLEPLAGKTLLDVGCGSGRYCIAYAQRGAQRVLGVDFAEAMIDIARDIAERAGVADRCEFVQGVFPQAVPDERFDACTANGFFDYIEDPVPLLGKMRELTRQTLIASFPKAVEWRVPARRLRFWFNGCPLFLYTAARVKKILAAAGVRSYEWRVLDRDYLVVARF